MDQRRDGAEQAQARGRTSWQVARSLRATGAASLRPGKVVPRGASAEMGALVLLAQRRSSHLGGCALDRRRRQRLRLYRRCGTRVSRGADAPLTGGQLGGDACLRGQFLLSLERSTPAGERGSAGSETR